MISQQWWFRGRVRAAVLAAAGGVLLIACAPPAARAEANRQVAGLAGPHESAARIVPTKRPMQCVPFARKASGLQIRGDAWTWWDKARGRYERGRTPRVGAVLVMKKTNRLRRGHVAVVTRIVDRRTIVVDQANWLNRGRIHLNTAVRDVSANNDWSAVRVWYTPGAKYGARTYPAHGFIHPNAPVLRVAGLAAGQADKLSAPGAQIAKLPAPAARDMRLLAAYTPAPMPARKPARAPRFAETRADR